MPEPSHIKISLFVRCPYCIETCYVDGAVSTQLWDYEATDKHQWFGQEMAPYGEQLSVTLSEHIAEAHPSPLHKALQREPASDKAT